MQRYNIQCNQLFGWGCVYCIYEPMGECEHEHEMGEIYITTDITHWIDQKNHINRKTFTRNWCSILRESLVGRWASPSVEVIIWSSSVEGEKSSPKSLKGVDMASVWRLESHCWELLLQDPFGWRNATAWRRAPFFTVSAELSSGCKTNATHFKNISSVFHAKGTETSSPIKQSFTAMHGMAKDKKGQSSFRGCCANS